ncbi:hypothetical protein [Streptomyces umbrinus]
MVRATPAPKKPQARARRPARQGGASAQAEDSYCGAARRLAS